MSHTDDEMKEPVPPATVGEVASDADERSTRGSFVRQLGKMVAVGVGIALLPVKEAQAFVGGCCPDWCRWDCTAGSQPWQCYDSCAEISCCVCLVHSPGCFTLPCACSG